MRSTLSKGGRRDEAVSPVIGTILMVAVTVVLAAILYVIVGPLINPEEEPPENLLMLHQNRVTQVDALHYDTSYTVTVIRTSERFSLLSISYVIQDSSGSILSDATFAFGDADSDGYVSEGDSIMVTGMLENYKGGTFKLLYKGSMIGHASIAMS
jgi:flagellin-like protein